MFWGKNVCCQLPLYFIIVFCHSPIGTTTCEVCSHCFSYEFISFGDHLFFPSYETTFVPYHPGNVLGTWWQEIMPTLTGTNELKTKSSLELVPKDRQRVKEKKQVDLVCEETQIIFSTQFIFFFSTTLVRKRKSCSFHTCTPSIKYLWRSHP